MTGKGRINSECMTPHMAYRGWNAVALRSAWAASEIRKMQQAERASGNFERADAMRAIAESLEEALDYVGIEYTPPERA